MARTKLEISKKEFQAVVDDLESKQTFTNPSALWKAVEETSWAKNQSPRALTAIVAYQRARELKIVIKTLPGKKGRQKGQGMPAGSKKRTPRSEKMKVFSTTFATMRKEIPVRYHNVIDLAEKGSLKAAIKLKCLDCTCWQPQEIKKCPIKACSLYPHRPFKQKVDEPEEAGEE